MQDTDLTRIASELVKHLQGLHNTAQKDVLTYAGAIEGVKLLVTKLQEHDAASAAAVPTNEN